MPKPTPTDLTPYMPDPSDQPYKSMQKINSLLYILSGSTNLDYQPVTTDDMGPLLQKQNQLFYDRVSLGAVGGITEAPMDGAQYVRQNGTWVAIKPPPQPFAPTLTSISPNNVPAGSPDTVITFIGTGFDSHEMEPCFGDQLMSWYTQMINPVLISTTEFQATLGANLLANPTNFFLWIQNTGGPDTNSLEFDVI